MNSSKLTILGFEAYYGLPLPSSLFVFLTFYRSNALSLPERQELANPYKDTPVTS
jgi:hypothetical protein